MWSNILDSIPVVGHVKGVVHYASGDTEAGNRSMRESTRSTAVMGAGAVGSIAGPAGAAGLAMATGALWDTTESIATDTPKGIVAGIENIAQTSSKGEVPVMGVLQTTLTLGGDALGGLGGGSIASSVTGAAGGTAVKSVGKSVGTSAGETILKSASVPAGETFGKSVAQSVGKSVGNTVGKTLGKSVGETVGKQAAKEVTKVTLVTYGAARAVVREAEDQTNRSNPPPSNPPPPKPPSNPPRQPSSRPTTQTNTNTGSSSGSSGGSGQQPPRQNPNNPSQQPAQQSHWQAFLNLFNELSLDQICIRGQFIFRNLLPYQKKDLRDLIVLLRKKNILRPFIETIVNILNTVDVRDVTFLNFMSLSEFVLVYQGEEAARRNELLSHRQTSPSTYEYRRNECVRIVGTELEPYRYTIVRVFQEIRDRIVSEFSTLSVRFRDIFTAVYHYYKHRFVDTYELDVYEYYGFIRTSLSIITVSPEYANFLQNGRKVEFLKYYKTFGMWLYVVVKKQGTRVDVSTCYFVFDCPHSGPNPDDGDTYINGRKV